MNENNDIDTQGAKQIVRRTTAERETIINEFKASGLTRKEFAKQRGLRVHALAYLLRPKKVHRALFAEVKVAASIKMPVEVELKNGVRIRLCCTEKQFALADVLREVSRC
jgi:hypothetical protein